MEQQLLRLIYYYCLACSLLVLSHIQKIYLLLFYFYLSYYEQHYFHSHHHLKSELTHLANCYIYKYTPSKSSLKKHKILQKLRSQKDIIITHPDKGNGIVILNRSDYIKSMTELISDKKKF